MSKKTEGLTNIVITILVISISYLIFRYIFKLASREGLTNSTFCKSLNSNLLPGEVCPNNVDANSSGLTDYSLVDPGLGPTKITKSAVHDKPPVTKCQINTTWASTQDAGVQDIWRVICKNNTAIGASQEACTNFPECQWGSGPAPILNATKTEPKPPVTKCQINTTWASTQDAGHQDVWRGNCKNNTAIGASQV
jgi:hypothetical protein